MSTLPHSTPPGQRDLVPGDPAPVWNRRCLLGLQDLNADEIRSILRTARSFADVSERSVKKVPALRGRVIANLFFEDSTRTRLSFTLAAQRLSADVIDLTETGSSVSKGESIADTVRNVEAMGVDGMVIRHKAAGASLVAARAVRCAVVNAGDGKHEHPTQGLLDVYTLVEARQKWQIANGKSQIGNADFDRLEALDLRGITMAIVGDIVSSRVARSNIAALTKLGAEVICVGPPTLAPRSLESLGCRVEHVLEHVLPHVDAVNMLRIQFERHGEEKNEGGGGGVPSKGSPAFPSIREYTQGFALTRERAARMKEGAILMHPGPMNRGIEIAGDVADGPRSVIFRQVTNGLAVRMAALYLCVSAEERGITAI